MAELEQRISQHELVEWQLYYELEPWGGEWENMLAGLITAAIYNVNRDAKRKPFKPSDFLFKPGEDEPVVDMSPDDAFARLKAFLNPKKT